MRSVFEITTLIVLREFGVFWTLGPVWPTTAEETRRQPEFSWCAECKHHTQTTHTSHARVRDFFLAWLKAQGVESSSQVSCVSHQNNSFIPDIQHSMSHALSLLCPSQLSTTSLSTLPICTPIQPSSCLSTRPFLTSSHGDFPCADPSNVSFGPVAETTSPTRYEFFHRPSTTST